MISVLAFSIGIGLLVSLLFIELFSVAAGGLIVPGYFALYLARPLDVVLTLLAAGVTTVLVRSVSPVALVYGRRRTVVFLVAGFVVGAAVRGITQLAVPETSLLAGAASVSPVGAALLDLTVIGFIVPGLIAIWFDRQGVVVTCASLLTAATVVRLLLLLLIPTELMWFEASTRHAPERVPAGLLE